MKKGSCERCMCLCHDCLNRTIDSSCGCKTCRGPRINCKSYIKYEQLQFFNKKNIRKTWEDYGISKERYKELKEYICSGIYVSAATIAAYEANKNIAEYILLSVKENKSYDDLRVKWELREAERIPYCRTDFYGIRRYFYYLFDLELKKIEKCKMIIERNIGRNGEKTK